MYKVRIDKSDVCITLLEQTIPTSRLQLESVRYTPRLQEMITDRGGGSTQKAGARPHKGR